MTTSLDTIRYHSGIAGEEVADMVDSLEQEVSTLREQVEKLTKERDAEIAGPEDSYQDQWFKAKSDSCAKLRAKADELEQSK